MVVIQGRSTRAQQEPLGTLTRAKQAANEAGSRKTRRGVRQENDEEEAKTMDAPCQNVGETPQRGGSDPGAAEDRPTLQGTGLLEAVTRAVEESEESNSAGNEASTSTTPNLADTLQQLVQLLAKAKADAVQGGEGNVLGAVPPVGDEEPMNVTSNHADEEGDGESSITAEELPAGTATARGEGPSVQDEWARSVETMRQLVATMAPTQVTAAGDERRDRRGSPIRNDRDGSRGRSYGRRGRADRGRSSRRRAGRTEDEPPDGSGNSSSDNSSGDERRRRGGGHRSVSSSRSAGRSSGSEPSESSGSSGSSDSGESSGSSDSERGSPERRRSRERRERRRRDERRRREERRRHERHRLEEERRRRAERRRRRQPRRGHRSEREEREEQRPAAQLKKSVKDLELPTFTPSPKVSVSTWIDRVDLALKGAAESGRGEWSDKSLYFILGNKLMEDASKWWVDMDRRTPERKRTWTNLKKALLRRYAEELDKSTAEWRVNMRRMLPGETHADFAAALRAAAGRNRVSERVLLAQFYRNLEKTTKKLVQQHPVPRTLEEAVEKAVEIDDPMDNVAEGMRNIGQPWATAPSRYFVPMDGTTGQTSVIAGVSGTGLEVMMASGAEGAATGDGEKPMVALFTNPQGVYNVFSGTWDPPPGHVWNGKYWYEPLKTKRRPATTASGHSKTEAKKAAARHKGKREVALASSDSEPEEKPRKKLKAAVKQAAVSEGRTNDAAAAKPKSMSNTKCFVCGQSGHWAAHCQNGPKCFACNQLGHLARDCTDADAKARNDEYLRKRGEAHKAPGNTNRTS